MKEKIQFQGSQVQYNIRLDLKERRREHLLEIDEVKFDSIEIYLALEIHDWMFNKKAYFKTPLLGIKNSFPIDMLWKFHPLR